MYPDPNDPNADPYANPAGPGMRAPMMPPGAGMGAPLGATPPLMPGAGPGMNQDRMNMDLYTRMGRLDPQAKKIARTRAMVEQLRAGGAMPGMRQAGGVSMAANPLEVLAAVGSKGLGEYRNRQADTAEDELGAAKRRNLDQWRLNSGYGETATD